MIVTPRLILGPWRDEDRAAHARMMADPEVTHDYPAPRTRAEADARFEHYLDGWKRDGFGRWVVKLRSDGGYLGDTGITRLAADDQLGPVLEIGWRLRRDAWGHGYVTEAAVAALDDIFQKTEDDDVFSYTGSENLRSRAVMERLGLERAEHLDFDRPNDRAVVYVARRATWLTRPASAPPEARSS